MGKRIDTFADYAIKMDQLMFSGPEDIVNDAAQFNTYTFFEAWRLKKNIESGNGFKDYIELTKSNTAEWVSANHVFNPVSDDGSVEMQAHFGRIVNYIYWDEEEVEDENDRMVCYKRIYKGKRIRKMQDTYDKLEAALWAHPTDAMNIPIGTAANPGTPRQMMSVLAFITATEDGVYVPSEFTTSATIQGVDPAVYDNFRNIHRPFSPGNFMNEIEDRLFEAYYFSTWNTAGGPHDGLMTGTPKDGCVIYCDFVSLKKCRQVLRNSNDRLVQLGEYDRSQGFGTGGNGILSYMGRPIVWAQPLGGLDTSEADQKMIGINWRFMTPTIRKGRFLSLKKSRATGGEFEFPNQPTARVLYEFTDVQLWCSSRRRHWLISARAAA